MSGQAVLRVGISAITLADRCEITTDEEHGLVTGNQIRVTDLNGRIPVPRGFDQINNRRYDVVVNSTTTFFIKDVVTGDYIDSTNFTPYVTGGSVNLFQTQFDYEGDD
jgi:hypothetical protein